MKRLKIVNDIEFVVGEGFNDREGFLTSPNPTPTLQYANKEPYNPEFIKKEKLLNCTLYYTRHLDRRMLIWIRT